MKKIIVGYEKHLSYDKYRGRGRPRKEDYFEIPIEVIVSDDGKVAVPVDNRSYKPTIGI